MDPGQKSNVRSIAKELSKLTVFTTDLINLANKLSQTFSKTNNGKAKKIMNLQLQQRSTPHNEIWSSNAIESNIRVGHSCKILTINFNNLLIINLY